MGVNHMPDIGCFFQIYEIQHLYCFFIQLVKRLRQRSLYKGIENILPFVLKTKRPLSDIWLLNYKQNSFGCFFFDQIEVLNYFENTQNCFAYISATKYRSETVLYSNRTAGHPLSPHIKTIAVAFLRAD